MTIKRRATGDEPKITHVTSDTGHSVSFAIACYDASVIAWLWETIVRRLVTDPDELIEAAGLTIQLHGPMSFSVHGSIGPLTLNRVVLDEKDILLTTEFLPAIGTATPDECLMAADCEQCMAVALAMSGSLKAGLA